MTFFSIVRDVANFLWGPPMLIFLLGSGLYLSLRLKGIQFTKNIRLPTSCLVCGGGLHGCPEGRRWFQDG